ncbi:MAG TPA: sugar phosphate isomerase/epimerase family protein [Thermomicrobiales bacterium]|nr:sugar phosphate isomerase/epimerase family protein [Thermomicrobiales bacterium]
MFNALIPGVIGIRGLNLAESINLAKEAGFQGVSFDIVEAKTIADEHGVDHLRAMFADAGLRPAVWSPPVNWTSDETRDRQIAELGPYAELGAQLGATNVTTGIMPANNDRPYDEQYEYLQTRLRPYAAALAGSGIRIGIEFITPKTLRDQFTYQFIYKMQDMLAFAKDIGTGNVGVLFDVWHHYCAHGTLEDMDVLTAEDVQLVHTNDAPAGITIDEQQDLSRTLPMETGVIPAPEMLRKLDEIGYDGAVAAEPFSQRINDLAARDPLAAARETCEAQKKLFAAAGLSA